MGVVACPCAVHGGGDDGDHGDANDKGVINLKYVRVPWSPGSGESAERAGNRQAGTAPSSQTEGVGAGRQEETARCRREKGAPRKLILWRC